MAKSQFYNMGSRAYKRGVKAAAQDSAMMNYIKKHSRKMGDSIPWLKQWNAGWYDAHLKESEKRLRKAGFTRGEVRQLKKPIR